MSKIREIFAIDLRSLALFRIALGSILFLDVAMRMRDLGAHYGDSGALPRKVVPLFSPSWSRIFFFSGSEAVQGVFFVVLLLSIVALTIGFRSRLATLVTWVLLLGVNARNPYLISGGDRLVLLLLFWSFFLPLDRWFSVGKCQSRSVQSYYSLASVGILLQVSAVIFFTGVLKFGSTTWLEEGSAIYHALHGRRTLLGDYLLALPSFFLEFSSRAVLLFEILGPFLLFSPFSFLRLRLVGISVLMGLMLSLGILLNVGILPFVAAIGLLLFLPREFWDFLSKRYSSFSVSDSQEGPSELSAGILVNCVAGLFLCNVIAINLSGLSSTSFKLPQTLRTFNAELGLWQKWEMFVHLPRNVSWIAVFGSGSGLVRQEITEFSTGEMIPKTGQLAGSSGNYRWMKYLRSIGRENDSLVQDAYLDFLCRRWNAAGADRPVFERIELFHAWKEILPENRYGVPHARKLRERSCRKEA